MGAKWLKKLKERALGVYTGVDTKRVVAGGVVGGRGRLFSVDEGLGASEVDPGGDERLVGRVT